MDISVNFIQKQRKFSFSDNNEVFLEPDLISHSRFQKICLRNEKKWDHGTSRKVENYQRRKEVKISEARFEFQYDSDHMWVPSGSWLMQHGMNAKQAQMPFRTGIVTRQIHGDRYEVYDLWRGCHIRVKNMTFLLKLSTSQCVIISRDSLEIVEVLTGYSGPNMIDSEWNSQWEVDMTQPFLNRCNNLSEFAVMVYPPQGPTVNEIINRKQNKALVNKLCVDIGSEKQLLQRAQIGLQLMHRELESIVTAYESNIYFPNTQFYDIPIISTLTKALWRESQRLLTGIFEQKNIPLDVMKIVLEYAEPFCKSDKYGQVLKIRQHLYPIRSSRRFGWKIRNVGTLKGRTELIELCNEYVDKYCSAKIHNAECPVCYECFSEVQAVVLSCRHCLCDGCWKNIAMRDGKKFSRCPLCRAIANA